MSDGGQEDQEEREQETNAVQTPATIVVGGADKGALRLVLAAVPSYDGTGDPHEWVHKALRKVGAFCTEAEEQAKALRAVTETKLSGLAETALAQPRSAALELTAALGDGAGTSEAGAERTTRKEALQEALIRALEEGKLDVVAEATNRLRRLAGDDYGGFVVRMAGRHGVLADDIEVKKTLSSWQDLVRRLGASEADARRTFTTKWSAMAQTKAESLAVFWARAISLWNKTYDRFDTSLLAEGDAVQKAIDGVRVMTRDKLVTRVVAAHGDTPTLTFTAVQSLFATIDGATLVPTATATATVAVNVIDQGSRRGGDGGGRSGGRGGGRRGGRRGGGGGRRGDRGPQCYACKGNGHMAFDCPYSSAAEDLRKRRERDGNGGEGSNGGGRV